MKHKQHIIITGGAGFIGSHIALRLIREGNKITILDNLSTGRECNIPKGSDFIKINLGNSSLSSSLKNIDCDAVFHLAGQSSGEASFVDPFYDLQSHVLSTFRLLEWCKQKKIPRFIYSSSMSVYGDPDYLPVDESHPLKPKTFYAAGKASAESYIKLHQTLGINTTILRLFSVYGPGQNLENHMQGMVSIYLSFMLNRSPLFVKGSGERFRDFVYIDDVVDIWCACINNPVTYGKVYNVASGKKTKAKGLVASLKDCFDSQDYPTEYKGSTPGDQFGIVADISRAKKDLEWKPEIDLPRGLARMVEFEKKRVKYREHSKRS